MEINSHPEIFHTIIPLLNRIQADEFRRYQSVGSKAKQVYLNTLAVSAVNSYLNFIGWSTSLEGSYSWNPIFQTMMDVADLQIPSYGKLECRFVLAERDIVRIPPEVWSGRIGYIIVELDKSLTQATLLGFVPKVKQVELPLNQLESLAEFPTFLSQQKNTTPTETTSLSRWFSGVIDQGWQQLEEIFAPSVVFRFRDSNLQTRDKQIEGFFRDYNFQNRDKQIEGFFRDYNFQTRGRQIEGVKFIQLGENTDYNLALVLTIQPQDRDEVKEFNISLTVLNNHSVGYLPEGLELAIIDEVGRSVMFAQANEIKTLEFYFSGKAGEGFSVEISLDEYDVVENFII